MTGDPQGGMSGMLALAMGAGVFVALARGDRQPAAAFALLTGLLAWRALGGER